MKLAVYAGDTAAIESGRTICLLLRPDFKKLILSNIMLHRDNDIISNIGEAQLFALATRKKVNR